MLNISKIISGVISPKMGLSILTTKIEQTIGHEVDMYVMQMNCISKVIDFTVYWPERLGKTPEKYIEGKHRYKLEDGENLVSMVKAAVKSQLNVNESIDFILIHYGETINVDVYYTSENGEKLKKSTSL